jgi:pilus assembly protein Flp/PilA
MIAHISEFLSRLRDDESGANLVEYALLAVLIALVVIASLKIVGTNLNTFYSQIAANLTPAS